MLHWETAAWDRPQTGDRLSLSCGPKDRPCAIAMGPPRRDKLNTPALAAKAGDAPPQPGPFLASATPSDILDAYPKTALQAGKDGRVTLRCQVTPFRGLEACAVSQEAPGGQGFGEAALKLAGRYKVKPVLADGKGSGGRALDIPISFAIPRPLPKTAPIKAGQWTGTFSLDAGSSQANAIAGPLVKAITGMKLSRCVSPEMAAQGAFAMLASSGCRLENVRISGAQATADQICRKENGEDQLSRLAINIAADHLTSRAESVGKFNGVIATDMTWTGAACTP